MMDDLEFFEKVWDKFTALDAQQSGIGHVLFLHGSVKKYHDLFLKAVKETQEEESKNEKLRDG